MANLIAISTPKGEYLTSLHFFYYILENGEGSRIASIGLSDGASLVLQDVDALAPLGGLELVKATQAGTGRKFAVNRHAVKRVRPADDNTAEIIFFDESSIKTQETYAALAPLFTQFGVAGTTVLTDGITILGNGDTIPLSVGVITGANIQDGSIQFADIQDISSGVLLGRYSAGAGPAQQVTLGPGLTFAAGALTLSSSILLGAANIGAGVGVYDSVDTQVLQLRSINGLGYLSAALNVDTIELSTIAEVNTASNVGGGAAELFYQKVGEDLQFRTIGAGAGVSFSTANGLITLNALFQGARNGLSLVSGFVEMGGALIKNTLVSAAGYNFQIQNAGAGEFSASTLVFGAATSLSLSGATLSGIFSGATLLQSGGINTIRGTTSVVLDAPVVQLGSLSPAPEVSVGNLYSFPSAAPSLPVDGDKKIMQWRNDAGVVVEEFVDPPSPGSGSGTSQLWYDITPAGVAFRKVLVLASGDGVTFTQNASNEWAFYIPDGVDLYSGSVFAETSGNPGSQLYVQFEFDGNAADGNPRLANTEIDNIKPPQARVVNMAAESLGGPTRLLPAAYNRLAGSALLEENITAAPGVAGADYIEIGYSNYSSNAAAGTGRSLYLFDF